MTKACIIAVLISLLFTIQARAAHGCVEQGAPTTDAQALELGANMGSATLHEEAGHTDDGGPDSHGGGHCDLCSHATVSAVGPILPSLVVTARLSERIALSASRFPASPPPGRPDKPPR